MDINPYGKGYADGHKGRLYDNPFEIDSSERKQYIEGYQDGSHERVCDATQFITKARKELS